MIGIKVKHEIFGVGTITNITNGIVTVKFPAKTSLFPFPGSFDHYLTVVDPANQQKIEDYKKAVKEESAKKEKEAAEAAENGKKINAKFGPDYNAQHLALQRAFTYQQVERLFGITISDFNKRIYVTDTNIVLISNIREVGGVFVYYDNWTKDGDYLYCGESVFGDQKATTGSLGVINGDLSGKVIHLLVKFSPQEYYYQGIFDLVNYTCEDAKDADGNIRKEYKFRLRNLKNHESKNRFPAIQKDKNEDAIVSKKRTVSEGRGNVFAETRGKHSDSIKDKKNPLRAEDNKSQQVKKYAFISYSSKNQSYADAMRTLFKKHNIDTWMAPYDIPAGSKYAAVITKAIRECSCFVLLLSNDSQASEAVDQEVELAVMKYKKSIVIIELEKVVLNDAFTFYVHNKQNIAAHKFDENSQEIAQILEAVKAHTDK